MPRRSSALALRFLPPALVFVGACLVLEIYVRACRVPAYLLPRPTAVLTTLAEDAKSLAVAVRSTSIGPDKSWVRAPARCCSKKKLDTLPTGVPVRNHRPSGSQPASVPGTTGPKSPGFVNWSELDSAIITQPGVTTGTVVDASGIASGDACEGLPQADWSPNGE